MPSIRLNNVNGELIKWARDDSGFSLEEVASTCGINEDVLEQIESNKTKPTLVIKQSLL
jgi:transcriptional regulator with XRE-family HTH domain